MIYGEIPIHKFSKNYVSPFPSFYDFPNLLSPFFAGERGLF